MVSKMYYEIQPAHIVEHNVFTLKDEMWNKCGNSYKGSVAKYKSGWIIYSCSSKKPRYHSQPFGVKG